MIEFLLCAFEYMVLYIRYLYLHLIVLRQNYFNNHLIEFHHILLTTVATGSLALREHGLERFPETFPKFCVFIAVSVSKFVLTLY